MDSDRKQISCLGGGEKQERGWKRHRRKLLGDDEYAYYRDCGDDFMNVYTLKFINLNTLNVCHFFNINHTSIKLLKKIKWQSPLTPCQRARRGNKTVTRKLLSPEVNFIKKLHKKKTSQKKKLSFCRENRYK